MAMNEKTCKRPGCGKTFRVEAPEKKRQMYCSGRCRTIVSRLNAKREERGRREKQTATLRETWKQFSPEVREKLEELLRCYKTDAAQVATDALLLLEQECKALARVRYREGYEEGSKQLR